MHIKRLRKHKVIEAVSFPTIIDIVVYQDEKGEFYTLKAILDSKPKPFGEAWAMAVMMNKFAPKHIIGEVEFEDKDYLDIRMDGILYRFAYGLPEKFWEIKSSSSKNEEN